MLINLKFLPLLLAFPFFGNSVTGFPQSSSADEVIHGVNLGGWLLIEPWITPGLFDSTSYLKLHDGRPLVNDEWTLCQALGKEKCRDHLQKHWEMFITLQDFQDIKAAGLTHVRIPIGYWAVDVRDDEPYVDGQLQAFERALGWARQTGVKVVIDLHGAPGSQNGFDNSGRLGAPNWASDDSNISRTLDVIQELARRYVGSGWSDVVVGFGILNENRCNYRDNPDFRYKLFKFNRDAYDIIRRFSQTIRIIVDDSQLDQLWETSNELHAGTGHIVTIDNHPYVGFGEQKNQLDLTTEELRRLGCLRNFDNLSSSNRIRSVIVGEWSGMFTDCAQHILGYRQGSKLDGTYITSPPTPGVYRHTHAPVHPFCHSLSSGTAAKLPPDLKTRLRTFLHAQVYRFNKLQGWFFWTWKTENGAPEWDLRDLIRSGLFPEGPNFIPDDGICGGLYR